MKTLYSYIYFVKTKDLPKTSVWDCKNVTSHDKLGEIRWYSPWRQYCFYPTGPAVYSAGCLSDIKNFIAQLTQEKNP